VKNITVHFPKPEELSPIFNANSVEGKDYSKLTIPKPVTSFVQAYGDYPEILHEVNKQGFSEPTPIQSQLWPCIMKGHDVVGIAQTGSGNTHFNLNLHNFEYKFFRQDFGLSAACFPPH